MTRLQKIITNALIQDNTIVVSKAAINNETKGFTQEYMSYLGIKKTDLKKLERHGLALRGYSRKETRTNAHNRKSLTQVMWVLIGDSNEAV